MGWGGIRRLQPIKHYLHHAIQITIHIVVPDPQNVETLCDEPPIPHRVRRPAVLAAINLDHQLAAKIGEVCDVRADSGLPAKVQPQPMVQIAKLRPEFAFLRGHFGPQGSRALAGLGGDAGHAVHLMTPAPHPNPPHEGEGGTRRQPPAPPPTGEAAPPLPLVGRDGVGGGGGHPIRLPNIRPLATARFIHLTLFSQLSHQPVKHNNLHRRQPKPARQHPAENTTL